MTVPVFDWAESDRTAVKVKPKVKRAQFGDGYEQRQADGINNQAQAWDLSFEEVDDSIADAMVAFWEARAGVEAFDWTPKWGTAPIRVVCEEWSRAIAGEELSTLSAQFRQVFEP